MSQIEIYIENLKTGTSTSVTLPVPNMKETITQLCGNQDFFACSSGAVQLGDNVDVYSLNEEVQRMEELEEEEKEAVILLWETGRLQEFREAVDIVEKGAYNLYHDCDSMTDVAKEIFRERGIEERIEQALEEFEKRGSQQGRTENLFGHILMDYEGYGRSLETTGMFYPTGKGVFVEFHRTM